MVEVVPAAELVVAAHADADIHTVISLAVQSLSTTLILQPDDGSCVFVHVKKGNHQILSVSAAKTPTVWQCAHLSTWRGYGLLWDDASGGDEDDEPYTRVLIAWFQRVIDLGSGTGLSHP